MELEADVQPENWKKLSSANGFEFNDYVFLATKDLFFKTVQIKFRFIKLSKNANVDKNKISRNNYGNFDDYYVQLKDGKILKGILNFNFAYHENNFNNKTTKGLIMHEVQHYYEAFKRIVNNKPENANSKTTNLAQKKIKENENNKFIQGLSFLMYLSLYFERNANLTSLYGELIMMGVLIWGDKKRFFKLKCIQKLLQVFKKSKYIDKQRNVFEQQNRFK